MHCVKVELVAHSTLFVTYRRCLYARLRGKLAQNCRKYTQEVDEEVDEEDDASAKHYYAVLHCTALHIHINSFLRLFWQIKLA